jgi:hypothetical protein
MINGVPLEVKEITCLDFPRGNALLQKYSESVAKYGDRARNVLGKLSLGDRGLIQGSNPFMAVQLGSLARLATPAELEQAVRQNPDFFRRTYEDVALVLRSEGDTYTTNDFLAKHLAQQVKARLGTMPTAEKPARISLKGMSLQENGNSPYGLVFNVGDAEVLSVPELSHQNNRRRFKTTNEQGVPIFDAQGNRTLYTRDNGLSGLFLSNGLFLGSDDEVLDYSFSVGRVFVVSGEATSQKILAEHLATLQKQRDAQIEGINTRFAQAQKILGGQ